MASLDHGPAALEGGWSPARKRGWRAAEIRVRLGVLPTWFWLGTIIGVSTSLRFASGLQTAAPWILPDELIYSELAKSVAASGHFAVRGQPFSVLSFGPLYPIVIAPIYRFAHTAPQAYEAIKALNSLLISLAAVPAYFVGRRLLTRSKALMLAAAAVLLPSTIYATKLMTESVAYPLFLAAVLAMFRCIEQPTARRQTVALLTIGLASLARIQMVVLLPALVATQLLLTALDLRRSSFELGSAVRRSARSVSLLLGVPLVVVTALLVFEGGHRQSLGSLLGSHDVASGRLHPGSVLLSMLYHLADLDLYVGVVPLAAVVVLLTSRHDGEEGRALERFLALSSILSIAVLVIAATYLTTLPATQPGAKQPHVYDRYVFYVVPLILALFLAWLERGLPRPRRRAAFAATVTGLLPALLPYSSLLNGTEWGVNSSTVALVPWGMVRMATSSGAWIVWAVTGYAVLRAFGFLRADVAKGRTLILSVLVNLVFIGSCVQIGNSGVAHIAATYGLARNPGWVDQAAGPHGRVIAIWSGKRGWHRWYGIWENEILNRRIVAVYHLRDPMPYDPPGTQLDQRGRTLFLQVGPLRAQYVLTDGSFPIAGRRIAADLRTDMVLYRVNGIVRLRPTNG